ncbi:MAG: tRNA 2-thiocytidine biosynthesis protein TtcA [Glaciecola sp.]|jgi:tRNA 2-thiocytidine biosynthesis protein TtcA
MTLIYTSMKSNFKELNIEKVERDIKKSVWKANADFSIVEEGDKIMVCLSGGKDSYTMLEMLIHMQSTPLLSFEIIAVNLDQKQPGYPTHILPEYLKEKGVNFKILEKDTYSVVIDKTPAGKTMCSLCSRLRRGTLYQAAKELGCNKVALGHHREDILETFFLNLYFSGKLETMPPIYETDDKALKVIRPLAYTKEKDIEFYSDFKKFPIIPCNLCGSQDGMQRQVLKKMMNEWDENYPDRKEVVFNALKNISPSHMLDKNLFDFSFKQESEVTLP